MSSTITALTSGGGLAMAGDTSGQLELKTNNGTTAVTVDTSQNVGVGTGSPSSYGKLAVVSADSAASIVASGATGMARIYGYNAGSGGVYIDSANAAQSSFLPITINSSTSIFATNGIERMRIDSSGNLQFNSGYGSVATAYGCRAWVSFNSDGSIRASGNVSSVSVVNSSSYNVNLTTAMPDTNYAVQWTVNTETNHFAIINSTSQINCRTGGSFSIGYMAIFR